ncbi:MAG: hypothetical protein ABIW76_04685 [Fibrobacteria bacterium]
MHGFYIDADFFGDPGEIDDLAIALRGDFKEAPKRLQLPDQLLRYDFFLDIGMRIRSQEFGFLFARFHAHDFRQGAEVQGFIQIEGISYFQMGQGMEMINERPSREQIRPPSLKFSGARSGQGKAKRTGLHGPVNRIQQPGGFLDFIQDNPSDLRRKRIQTPFQFLWIAQKCIFLVRIQKIEIERGSGFSETLPKQGRLAGSPWAKQEKTLIFGR